MKIKHLLRFAFVACAFWVLAGCDGLTPGRPNLYIGYEKNKSTSEFYYVTYVRVGQDAHEGRNIFSKRLGEFEFKGNYYHMFSIPRGSWDIYFEYYDSSTYGGFDNERETVNTRLNDWVRIEYRPGIGYWTYSGEGEMY